MEGWDNTTKSAVQKIPLLTVKAGPRDGELWKKRLKEEYQVKQALHSGVAHKEVLFLFLHRH